MNRYTKQLTVKDLKTFLNQMESEGLSDDTVLYFEGKRVMNPISSIEYGSTDILIFG